MPSTPHLLLASGNVQRLHRNIEHLLDDAGNMAIRRAIDDNVRGLFQLGEVHLDCAMRLGKKRDWRQRVSRLYYAAFGFARALRLAMDGSYSEDVAEHKKFNDLPDDFELRETYVNRLRILRKDRNLCDYDHTATVADLVYPPADSLQLVQEFRDHVRNYLAGKGTEP